MDKTDVPILDFGQVQQMIETKIVDFNEYMPAGTRDARNARLLCWVWNTPSAVSSGRRRPAVLILPGGGYQHVSPREAEPVAMRFLARGYCAFVLEYACAPCRFPTALRQAAMAMRYLRERADSMELDPNRIAVIGFSAGGHLCGTLGTLFDSPEVADIGDGALLRPDALGLCYPVAVSWGRTHEGSFENLTGGDTALRERLSLDRLVRPDMPPVFLWHTRDDGSVPVRNSLVLASALEAAGVDFAMHIYRKGPHGLSTGDIQSNHAKHIPEMSEKIKEWPETMMDFFEEIGFRITDVE